MGEWESWFDIKPCSALISVEDFVTFKRHHWASLVRGISNSSSRKNRGSPHMPVLNVFRLPKAGAI